ncbi:hypothetical protein LIA77_03483 [Sarocladium implicatum]|nr:hypothetical protein LIA77_03483 [Sarocladium implicatum]
MASSSSPEYAGAPPLTDEEMAYWTTELEMAQKESYDLGNEILHVYGRKLDLLEQLVPVQRRHNRYAIQILEERIAEENNKMDLLREEQEWWEERVNMIKTKLNTGYLLFSEYRPASQNH